MAKIKKKQAGIPQQAEMEIRSLAHTTADLYGRYRTQFNTILTVLIIAVIVAVIYSFTKGSKERQAGRMLDAAYAFYNPPTGGQPSYEKALAGYQEIVKQYGGTLSSATAQYLTGNALVQMGRPEEALKAYDEFLKRYAGEKLLAAMVHQRKGYIYASQGKREDAIRSFAAVDSLIGTGMATMELARIYEQAGNAEAAIKRYSEVVEKLPATTLAMEARAKLPPPDMKAPLSKPAGAK